MLYTVGLLLFTIFCQMHIDTLMPGSCETRNPTPKALHKSMSETALGIRLIMKPKAGGTKVYPKLTRLPTNLPDTMVKSCVIILTIIVIRIVITPIIITLNTNKNNNNNTTRTTKLRLILIRRPLLGRRPEVVLSLSARTATHSDNSKIKRKSTTNLCKVSFAINAVLRVTLP